MSVNVSVRGAEKDSDEYQAALKLKNIIQNTSPYFNRRMSENRGRLSSFCTLEQK